MSKDSRGKLIETATQLFAEKGFAEVSIRELAKAAEVNSALIAYYFGGKEGLYEAVLEEYFQRIEEYMESTVLSDRPSVEKLKKIVVNLVAIHHEMPYLRKFLSREFINPSASTEIIVKKYISRFLKMSMGTINDAVKEGVIREDIIPQFVPFAFAGIVHFYFMAQPVVKHLSAIFPEFGNEQIFITQIQEIWLNGLLQKGEGENG